MDQDFADELAEILPKSAHKKIPQIMEALAAKFVARLDVPGGRLEVEQVEYPGAAIGLDASGNAVSVTLDGTWDVTYE